MFKNKLCCVGCIFVYAKKHLARLLNVNIVLEIRSKCTGQFYCWIQGLCVQASAEGQTGCLCTNAFETN